MRLHGAMAFLVAFSLAGSASAETVVVPDPTAAREQAELAGAVSLLVRSYLKPGQREITPRRELALAIEAMSGHSPGQSLSATAETAPNLMEKLAADRLVLWELQVGPKGTTVAGVLIGPGGKRLLRIAAAAATGDVASLAQQLARRIAPAIGATQADMPAAGVADLRPFLAAESALLAGDAVAASRAVALALPTVATKIPAAKDILRAIAEDPGLPALPRVQARLLMGEWNAAVEQTDDGLARDPKNISLRSAKVHALAALKDFASAERELTVLKTSANQPVVVLARVALAIERGDPMEKKDEALAPLVGRPAGEWRQVLPLIAATPPGTFGARIEAAALEAAAKLSFQEPGLASTLAARALAGGAQSRQATSLIKVQDLSAEQITTISARLNANADSASAGLIQQIKARQEEAEKIAAASGPEKPTGPPSTLALSLLPVLQGFDGLYEPSLTEIKIAPLPGSGQPFYWPFLVRKARLADGLLEALMRSPWELAATTSEIHTDALSDDRLTDEGLATLASDLGSSALLLYGIRPAGYAPWVTVELVLYDAAHQRTERAKASLIGRSTGLVMLNPLMVGLFTVAFMCAFGWAVLISLRGTVVVRVQWDSDSKDELFSILISRSPTSPVIDNLTAYRKKLEWLGKRKRRFEAWNIDQNTTFRGIPRGRWYVHLFGIYTRGRQTLRLKEPAQMVEVQARKAAFVAHVLEAAEAEFKIVVVDDLGTVEGARVWLDDDRAKAVSSAKDGAVTLKVPKGYHVIHVTARGMAVERPYQVVKSKVHEMTINLVWERRQEFVSRALERQVDDAAKYMSKPARITATVAPTASPTITISPPFDVPVDDPVDLGPAIGETAAGRQTVSLKPLSPELAQTMAPPTPTRRPR